jgi:hypothetical protein
MLEIKQVEKDYLNVNCAELIVRVQTPTDRFKRLNDYQVEITIKNITETQMSVNGKECEVFNLQLNGFTERQMLLDLFDMIKEALT